MDVTLPFSFEDIDFVSGRLMFYMNTCDEDSSLLAHIEYPNNFDIMVEHYGAKKFTAALYWGIQDHCPPVAVFRVEDISLLKKAVAECVKRAEREAEGRRFSYYGKLFGYRIYLCQMSR